jgi:hypothetical protein
MQVQRTCGPPCFHGRNVQARALLALGDIVYVQRPAEALPRCGRRSTTPRAIPS